MSKTVLTGADAQFPDDLLSKEVESPSFPSIEERVLQGVGNGLDSIGVNVKQVFYAEMESSYGLEKAEICDNPERFSAVIIKFFTVGASFIERAIGREVLKMFDLPPSAGLNFRTSLEIVKRHPHKEMPSG
ncbi:MAG: hypothetical protein ACREBS_04885 [Nitrososphaerales archaeon]